MSHELMIALPWILTTLVSSGLALMFYMSARRAIHNFDELKSIVETLLSQKSNDEENDS